MSHSKVVVLDFGGQYAHLIARRIRQMHVFSEIRDSDVSAQELKGANGIILSGGPASVTAKDAPHYDKRIFELGVPVLGICYGHQVVSHALGGKVAHVSTPEYGAAKLRIDKESSLLKGLSKEETVWISHWDTVSQLPKGFRGYAHTDSAPNAVVGDPERNIYGIQFHAEVTHTPNGQKVLENFVLGICKCKQDWTMEGYLAEKTAQIKKQVGKNNVFLLVSGGVDSTVALVLLNRALGNKRIYGLHIDTGFMRENESVLVGKVLKDLKMADLHVLDSSKEFFSALKGVTDAEEKRKIIGQLFIDVANRELRKLNLNPDEWLLGQGTIYPDTIESGRTKHAALIKTHHNRVDSIKQMIGEGKIVEPLDELYKDEVRELGLKLGLPDGLVWRHPFPGPGLAIRALCSDGKPIENLQDSQQKCTQIASEHSLDALVLPLRSVGVQGDIRTYARPCLIAGNADFELLEQVSTKITNETYPEVNRVAYSLFPANPTKFMLLERYLTPERMDLLRKADSAVQKILEKYNLMKELWQCPVILLPVSFDDAEGETIVIRPVLSQEAMTARFAILPQDAINEIVESLIAIDGIDSVLYDITHKPPATICWE